MTRSDPGAMHLHSVGCTAEIRQVYRQETGALSIVAKGEPWKSLWSKQGELVLWQEATFQHGVPFYKKRNH